MKSGSSSVELSETQAQYLQAMVQKYDLEDEGKAIRCLINFAREETAQEANIFEEIRCFDC